MQETVSFAKCPISQKSFRVLSDAVSGWPNLTTIDLQGSNISISICPQGAESLAASLASHSILTAVNIAFKSSSRYSAGPAAAVLLPALFSHHKDLRQLQVTVPSRENWETPPAELSALSNLTSLTSLSFSRMFLPAPDIAAALPHLTSLQELNLCRALVGCCPEVIRSLSALTKLTLLHLEGIGSGMSNNPLPCLPASLCSSLRSLKNLRSLDLSDNNMEGGWLQLAASLATLSKLCSVSLRFLKLRQGEALRVVKALEHLSKLTVLDLECSVDPDEYAAHKMAFNKRMWVSVDNHQKQDRRMWAGPF